MSDALMHYGIARDKVIERVQDGDNLVAEAVAEYEECSTWESVAGTATVCRNIAVHQKRFLVALIHDTIHHYARWQIDNE